MQNVGELDVQQVEANQALARVWTSDTLREIFVRLHSCKDVARSSCVCKSFRDAGRRADLWAKWFPLGFALEAAVAELGPSNADEAASSGTASSLPELCGRIWLRCLLDAPLLRSFRDLHHPEAAHEGWRLTMARGQGARILQVPALETPLSGIAPSSTLAADKATSSTPSNNGHAAESLAEGQSCLATSYRQCEVRQVVDLVPALERSGCPAPLARRLLDAGLPLGLEVEYGASEADPGQGSVLLLLDDSLQVLPPYNSGGFPHNREQLALEQSQELTAAPGARGVARLLAARYPPGARRAVVLLRGNSRAALPGHEGLRFFQARLMPLPEACCRAFLAGEMAGHSCALGPADVKRAA